jgi:hypothetical protein
MASPPPPHFFRLFFSSSTDGHSRSTTVLVPSSRVSSYGYVSSAASPFFFFCCRRRDKHIIYTRTLPVRGRPQCVRPKSRSKFPPAGTKAAGRQVGPRSTRHGQFDRDQSNSLTHDHRHWQLSSAGTYIVLKLGAAAVGECYAVDHSTPLSAKSGGT